MLRPRLIPFLLLQNKNLVKTIGFDSPKYVGDPLNAVRIFNEKEVDELIIADMNATTDGNDPNYELIAKLAYECRMPLCYAGGVKTLDQVERVIALGVEKVALGTVAGIDSNLIYQAARRVGSQSIVIVVDVKKVCAGREYEVFINGGRVGTGMNPVDFVKKVEELGAGEILLNSIDADGSMTGYDFKLIDSVRSTISLPLTVLGGAGSLNDIKELFSRYGTIGAAAGSLFVFKGKYRAVLIQYPNSSEREQLYAASKFPKKNDINN